VVVFGAPVLERPARACVPSDEGQETLLNPVGTQLPANGLLVSSRHCGLQWDELRVLVDGVEAATSIVPLQNQAGYRIEPPPPVGSMVEISAIPMEERQYQTFDQCDPLEPVVAVVVEADLEAPAPPEIGVTVLADRVGQVVDCGLQDVDVVRWDVQIEPAVPEDNTLVVASLIDPSGEILASKFPLPDPIELALTVPRDEFRAGEYCVEVRTFDGSGNEAPPVRECKVLESADELFDASSCSVVAGAGRGFGTAWMLGLFGLVGYARRRAHGR